MSPAKELEKLAPWAGNWKGSGKMMEPGGVSSNWTAKSSCQWVLNKHFLQEDFYIKFDNLDTPMTFRNYYGWDREQGRYCVVSVSNEGKTRFSPVTLMPDGSMMQMIMHSLQGVPYVERAKSKVTGDKLHMHITVMMPENDAITMIDSEMTRTDETFECDWGEDAWMGAQPNEQMKKVRVLRGQYETKGEMVMMPGTEAMKISGTDRFMMIWDGNVMHGTTLGFAEGAPEAYESHAFWAWDSGRKCISAVYVSNMGEVGQMDVHWVEDKVVSTSSGVAMGMPMTQRFVMNLDRKGQLKGVVGHTCMAGMEPYVSFKANFTRTR